MEALNRRNQKPNSTRLKSASKSQLSLRPLSKWCPCQMRFPGMKSHPNGNQVSPKCTGLKGTQSACQGTYHTLAEVLQHPKCYFSGSPKQSLDIRGSPGRRKRGTSSRKRRPRKLLGWSLFHHLLLPQSSNCWDDWGSAFRGKGPRWSGL